MNISKHFTKQFRLNFTVNQNSQNPEQHTHTVHISESHCYVVKSNNLSTVFAVLYKRIIKNKKFKLSYRIAMATLT
jgi:hypothetical protein